MAGGLGGEGEEFRRTVENIAGLNARLLSTTEHCGLLRLDLRAKQQV